VQILNDRRSKLTADITILSISNFLRIFFSFLCLTVAARVIPKDNIGVCFLIFVIVALLEVVGGLGLGQSVVKFITSSSGYRERQKIVNNIMTFRLMTMLVLSLLVIVLKQVFISLFRSDLLATLFLYIPLLYCVQSADSMLDFIMQGFQLYRKMAFIRVINAALNFALVLLFLIIVKLGVRGYILAIILSFTLTCFLRYWMIPTAKGLTFEPKLIRKLLQFGLPLQGSDILSFISEKLDILIVGSILRPTAVSYLGIAKKIPENLQRVSNSLHTVYFPHMSDLFGRKQQIRAEEVMHHFLRLTAFVTTLGALLIILFQREIIVLIFSEEYAPSAPAFGFLMVIFILMVASTILDFTLIAAGHPGYLPIISLADTVPSLLANLILIPIYGFMGAVYAKLIANIITNPFSVWALHREKIGINVKVYLKPIFLLLICLGIYYGFGLEIVVLKGMLIVIFIVFSVYFSIITKGDILDLLKVLRLYIPKEIVRR